MLCNALGRGCVMCVNIMLVCFRKFYFVFLRGALFIVGSNKDVI
jgi:hypothetical protein